MLLLKTFAELPRVDQRVSDACGTCRMFAALCRSLTTLHALPESAAVMSEAAVAQVAAGVGQYVQDVCAGSGASCGGPASAAGGVASASAAGVGAASEQQTRRAAEDLRAFAGLCSSVAAPGRSVAVRTAQHLCSATPSLALPLSQLLWQEMRQRCECAALAEGTHAFAEHWPAAVAVAAVVLGLPGGGSEGSAALLRKEVRAIVGKEETIANPADCAAVAAALAACEVHRRSSGQSDPPSNHAGLAGWGPDALLAPEEQQQLFGGVCEMLPWLCDMVEVSQGHTRALFLATATAQTVLLAVLGGMMLPAPGQPEAAAVPYNACLQVPEAACQAAMKLCGAGFPEPARLAAVMLLTAVRPAVHLHAMLPPSQPGLRGGALL